MQKVAICGLQCRDCVLRSISGSTVVSASAITILFLAPVLRHDQAVGGAATLHFVALWCIASGSHPLGSGREGACTMWVSAISQFVRLRIGIHSDYAIVHGPESMPPAYAAPEIRPLAPDHSGGIASDVSLDPSSGCRP